MIDHVFKEVEGTCCMEFVGDFEAKYKAEDDPWEQSGGTGVRAEYYQFARTKLLARLHNRVKERALGLEIGCGYGYLTELLAKRYRMVGMDVSETALKRANMLHPGIEYVLGDITKDGFVPPNEEFHFCILAQCWWYVMHKYETALENCKECLVDGGLFVLHQAFLKEQKYGRDIADGFHGAVKLFMDYPGLRLIEASYEDSGELCYYDGLIILRKV